MVVIDPNPLSLSAPERQQIDELLTQFQRDWQDNRFRAQARALEPFAENLRSTALFGLIRIDLERQWQAGNPVRVENYLAALPELGTTETAPSELILAEFMAREAVGQAPDWKELAERFPNRIDELRRLIESAIGPLRNSPSTDPSRNRSIHEETTTDAPRLPEHFGRYRILKTLGVGGMGSVYLAYDTRLERRVALKVPRFAQGTNPENLKRFYRESKAAATIVHPNLCPLFDVGEIDGTPYLTMPFIEGWPLSRFIKPSKRLPQFAVATLVRLVAYAIGEAHKHGVIHRDLKPTNIMINKRGEPIVMDFGLARWVDQDKEDGRLTKNGAILGAPVYMSPEQVHGDVEAMGAGCDVYSLGVILYELLTARLPFEGPTTTVLAKTLIQPPKPPTSHREDVDPRLEAICLKALAKKPEERFPTMQAMASALTEFIRAERRNQSGHAQYASTLTDSSDPFPDESADVPTSFNAGHSKVSPNLKALRQGRLLWSLAAGAGLLGAVLVLMLPCYFLYSFFTKPKSPPINATSPQPRGNIVFSLNKFGDDVELRVDGKLVRASDQQVPLQLTPGEHHVIVAAPKHEVFMKTFVIREGDNPAFVIELQPRKKSDS